MGKVVLLLVTVLFLFISNTFASNWNLENNLETRRFASLSGFSLSKGQGDCLFLAEYYQTLGEVVREHAKEANVENIIVCKKMNQGWSCTARDSSTMIKSCQRWTEHSF